MQPFLSSRASLAEPQQLPTIATVHTFIQRCNVSAYVYGQDIDLALSSIDRGLIQSNNTLAQPVKEL